MDRRPSASSLLLLRNWRRYGRSTSTGPPSTTRRAWTRHRANPRQVAAVGQELWLHTMPRLFAAAMVEFHLWRQYRSAGFRAFIWPSPIDVSALYSPNIDADD